MAQEMPEIVVHHLGVGRNDQRIVGVLWRSTLASALARALYKSRGGSCPSSVIRGNPGPMGARGFVRWQVGFLRAVDGR
jgi:hypothetical protein